MDNNQKFTYTYSAPTESERREIESIRRQYKLTECTENKVDRLRSLHSKVVGAATAASLVLGVVGTLIFGTGMALALEFNMLIPGIIVAALGAVPMALAYPVHKKMIEKGKEKYGDEILRLSDELLGE